jgi:hypothetical protein
VHCQGLIFGSRKWEGEAPAEPIQVAPSLVTAAKQELRPPNSTPKLGSDRAPVDRDNSVATLGAVSFLAINSACRPAMSTIHSGPRVGGGDCRFRVIEWRSGGVAKWLSGKR